jgi:oxygen-independent coproporphyrinogen-3 oxidase
VRWWNVKHPARYAALLDGGQSPAAGRETLDHEAQTTERLMLAVRTRRGLPLADVPDAARHRLRDLASWGLIEPVTDAVVLTQRGRLMADAVVTELLAAL